MWDSPAWEVDSEKKELHKGQRSLIQNSFMLYTYPLWKTNMQGITDWFLLITEN